MEDTYCATEGAEVSTLDHLKDLEMEYDVGYKDGMSSVEADIEFHLNERCGQPDGDDRTWAEYTQWMWDEIERLRLKSERQRLALYAIAHYSRQPNSMGAVSSDYFDEIRDMHEIASRALRLEEEE